MMASALKGRSGAGRQRDARRKGGRASGRGLPKPYSSPTLKTFGTLHDLTSSNPGVGPDALSGSGAPGS